MRSLTILLLVAIGLTSCSSKSPLEGTWTGTTGKDGYDVEMKISGQKVDIDFASKKTTAKLKANGEMKIEGEVLTTTIAKASIDKGSLTGQMKELIKEKGVKEETEKVTQELLSKQLTGPFKVQDGSLRISGNPMTIVFTKK